MQEERDFYKREYELMRNLKDKHGAYRSPPTRDKVCFLMVIFACALTDAFARIQFRSIISIANTPPSCYGYVNNCFFSLVYEQSFLQGSLVYEWSFLMVIFACALTDWHLHAYNLDPSSLLPTHPPPAMATLITAFSHSFTSSHFCRAHSFMSGHF